MIKVLISLASILRAMVGIIPIFGLMYLLLAQDITSVVHTIVALVSLLSFFATMFWELFVHRKEVDALRNVEKPIIIK